MDNYRLILVFTLAFLGLLLYQAWQDDYGPKPMTAEQQAVQTEQGLQEMPSSGGDVALPDTSGAEAIDSTVPTQPNQAKAIASRTIKVETDLYSMEIDTRGGNIVSLYLREYPVSVESPETKFRLMSPVRPNLFVAQSGLLAKTAAPTHESAYQAAQGEYTMEEGEDSLVVDLKWQEGGVEVTKRFEFQRGNYTVKVRHIVDNHSGAPWAGREYRQLIRTELDEGMQSQFIYTYTGAVYYSPEEKYKKYSFDDMESAKLDLDVKNGWIAMLQHYFVGAWVPPKEQMEHFYSKVLSNGRYLVGAYTPSIEVAPGDNHVFETTLFAGPKLQDEMQAVAPGLELAVDYGWLTILAQPIFWLLRWIHDIVGNWGWSIIILTILIKAAFYKLSEASYISMAGMRKLGPRIQALKDRYGDDKQRMNQAMMDIYKKEKINPLGGCLPILVQIPVFIALYWVLLESVEMRQAPFILWIEDLSIKDPYFVLPLIMGISMFVQQKLNPAPPDPMQAKIMMSLPFVFTIFFAFFPSGLVLYWVVNNLLSISQQWYITRKIEAGEKV
jgi:YidC/Oxa1 family membrane protein insertase